MTNPYGITLEDVWAEWAAEHEVPGTVAAGLYLLSKRYPCNETAAKLTPGELEQIIAIVRRWPDDFPPQTLAALEAHGHAASPKEQAATDLTDAAPSQPVARINPGTERMRRTRERHRKGLCLVTVEVPQSAIEAARRGDMAGITAAVRDAVVPRT